MMEDLRSGRGHGVVLRGGVSLAVLALVSISGGAQAQSLAASVADATPPSATA
jgi:hypothetical protein